MCRERLCMKMIPRTLLLFLVIATPVVSALCPPYTLEEQAANSNLIVIGSVVRVDKVGTKNKNAKYVATLAVAEVLKGKLEGEQVSVRFSDGWFGAGLESGYKYLLFFPYHDETLSVRSCEKVALLSDEQLSAEEAGMQQWHRAKSSEVERLRELFAEYHRRP